MNIAQTPQDTKFDRHGWPISPITGQPYTRDEIVTNPSIPYPLDVDTTLPYWRRRTPQALAAEKAKAAKKRQRRTTSRRKPRQTTFALTQAADRGLAQAELVTRVNKAEETDTVLVNANGNFAGVMEV